MCAHDEIFKLFIKGDRQAMSILVEAYKNELFNLCFRLTFNQHDAEDLFQQTWVKATKNAAKYEHQSFKPWLLKICINQYRDNYRQYVKRKNHVKDDFESTSVKEYVLMAAGSTDSVEEQYERKHIQALIIANIDKLPQPQKVPMVLYYYQQMKYSEIAGVLGVPEGTIKSRINTAKKKLKSVLESELYV